jgi:hypothetical protein
VVPPIYGESREGESTWEKRSEKTSDTVLHWFGHVDVGMYRAVSGEPVSYVRNIYKYYVTFKRLEEARLGRERALSGHD